MRSKKGFINLTLFLLLALAIVFIYVLLKFGGPGNLVRVGDYTYEKFQGEEYWNGDVFIESNYFGQYTSGDRVYNPITKKQTVSSICGNNDGDIDVSNSYAVGTEFHLASSTNARRSNCEKNYIKASFNLPAGVLYGDYLVTAWSGFKGEAVIKVTGLSNMRACERQADVCSGGSVNRKDDSFILTLDEPQIITVELVTSGEHGGGSSANLDLSFIPSAENSLPSPVGDDFPSKESNELNWFQKLIQWFLNLFRGF